MTSATHSATPSASPKFDAYLTFDGTCAEAFRFYERALGAKVEALMTVGDSPMAAEVPPSAAGRIMHGRLSLDGRILMAADAMGERPYEGMKGFSLNLDYPTVAKAEAAFAALAEGGRVEMPLQQTFWADRFGMVVDRFGTPWMIHVGVKQG